VDPPRETVEGCNAGAQCILRGRILLAMPTLSDLKPTVLAGARVKLVPLQETDAAELFAAGRDQRVWSYLPRGPFTGKEDALRFIRRALEEQAFGKEVPYAIRERETGALVGTTRYASICARNGSVEIAWTFLCPSRWGTRAVAEVMVLMVAQAIEQYGAVRVWLKTDARNVRLIRAMEHGGVTREGVLRRHLRVSEDFVRDSVIFSVIAEEWPELKRRSERFWRGVRP
jgi:RimJ/RimL family protein N-acetyltransferase